MSSAGELVHAALSDAPSVTAVLGTDPVRVYPGVLPQTCEYPAAVYQVVLDRPLNSLGGFTSGARNVLVQVDVYARSYLAAQDLADRIRSGLRRAAGAGARGDAERPPGLVRGRSRASPGRNRFLTLEDAMTQAVGTKFTELRRGNGADPEVFTPVKEVVSWTGPAETASQIEVTSLQSPAKEFISGLRDGGEVTLELNFIPSDAGQQGLRTDLSSGTTRNFELVLPDNTVDADRTTIEFAAIVTSFQIQGGVDAAVKASCTLKISGEATYTYSDQT